MNNYVYIISSLPVLTPDAEVDADKIIDEIREQCSDRDRDTIDFLMDGFDGTKLDADFYRKALAHGSAFIRSYFGYDLDVRNAKARFLNRAFQRPEETDVLTLGEEERDFEEAARLADILAGTDILGREKALDELMWEKIDTITLFDYFDLDAILGFIAKLKITDRWFKLDEETGRALFRRITEQVRATFKGVEFEG
ncbi:MAG: DUF2764 family protein [Bacteroidales bacterium]|nr:DUF2764 family protein [Bacteroidales bacterium]